MVDLSNAMPAAPAKPGHNNPPTDMELLKDGIFLRYAGLFQEVDRHIALAAKIPLQFSAQNEADFTTDFIKKVKLADKQLDECRTLEKEPYLRMGQFVDGFFGDKRKQVADALARASTPLTAYLNAQAAEEQKRRAKEAADLARQAEAAAKELAAAPRAQQPAEETTRQVDMAITMHHVAQVADSAARAPITTMAAAGTSGAKAGLKEKWTATITDVNALDLGKLRPFIAVKALEAALAAYVKAGNRQIEGAKIEKTLEAKVK